MKLITAREVQRKAWMEIKRLRTATNFIEAQAIIDIATHAALGTNSTAIKRILFRKRGGTLESWNKISGYMDRNRAMNEYRVKEYLLTFVNDRLKSCKMYRDFLEKLNPYLYLETKIQTKL